MDPITGSETTWIIVAAAEGYEGAVYDIKSGAPGTGKDGKPYAEW
jgi:general secretion pathway protein G